MTSASIEPSHLRRALLHGGWLASLAFALAVVVCGALTAGYEPARHAIGLLGSVSVPHATAFNVLAYGLSGILLAGLALAMEPPLRAAGVGRSGRIATYLLLISALAFAAQGVFAFEPRDGDGAASRRHVFAYSIALLAWLPSTALFAFALRGRPGYRALAPVAAMLATMFAGLLLFPADSWLPGLAGQRGHAQRLQLALYFAWPALLAFGALRAIRQVPRDPTVPERTS